MSVELSASPWNSITKGMAFHAVWFYCKMTIPVYSERGLATDGLCSRENGLNRTRGALCCRFSQDLLKQLSIQSITVATVSSHPEGIFVMGKLMPVLPRGDRR